MNNYLILIIVGAVGVWVGYRLAMSRKAKSINSRASKERVENMEKLRRFIESRDRTTNDDVENLLGVSDATAERYLAELEKEGALKQMGSGKGAYYEKTPH